MIAVLLLVLILGGGLAGPGMTWASPAEDQALMQRVVQNISRENYEEALGDLKRAWQQGPKTPEKAYLFGMVYRHMMRYKEARGYLEEAVTMRPSFPEAQLMLADTLIALNQPEQALPHLQQLQTSGYEPGQTVFLLGMAAYKQKQFSDAVEYFRQAQRDPKLTQEAKFQESMALAAQNRLAEARKAMESAADLNPHWPKVMPRRWTSASRTCPAFGFLGPWASITTPMSPCSPGDQRPGFSSFQADRIGFTARAPRWNIIYFLPGLSPSGPNTPTTKIST